MTKRQLFFITLLVMVFYMVAIAAGITLRIADTNTKDGLIYSTYKDLLPLIIAVPAAYLAYSFQRRTSYVQALRKLWSDLVAAVQAARTYTYMPAPTYEQYAETIAKLSIVIEEARGVFCNIKAKGAPDGWYPFEPIKEIHNDIRDLGYGEEICRTAQKRVRDNINRRWKLVRSQLLREYDRYVPTHHYTWYTNLSNKS